MKKEISTKERMSKTHYLLGLLYTAINCSTDSKSLVEVMEAIKHDGTQDVWVEMIDSGDTRETALKEIRKITRSL